ncbi:transaldolase [Demequina activiva]|uniref:Transaldolase n=1 Tax=Demequina activiva TaxID=1582364 RepID=A0A919Q352_9MICO|nr:transaldolase [Demequina activiva]GIG54377.1 transaldolase 1 [Demequina activiva]
MTATTQTQPLAALSEAGVSIWLDDLSRERLRSGSLAQDIEDSSIVGVTTNPSIFAAAVSGSDQYDAQIGDLAARGVEVDEAVRMITTADVREACDVLRPVYDRTDGVDGRVSIEVDPRFARDTGATIAEARQLWWLVDRPNAMVKIPGTREGLPAITQALVEGISVNVTLIFSLERYAEVVDAFLDGLEAAHAAGHDLSRIGSVASFFVSRVDAEVDKRLDAGGVGSGVRGTAAIANARLAFEHHEQVLASERWQRLASAGAHPQRPLWASTSVKDDAYPDTMYVDELVTAGTVNTMPQGTIDAFADHGQVPSDPEDWDTVRGTYDEARSAFERLESAGVDLADVTAQLEDEGIQKFADSWEELLDRVREQMGA